MAKALNGEEGKVRAATLFAIYLLIGLGSGADMYAHNHDPNSMTMLLLWPATIGYDLMEVSYGSPHDMNKAETGGK